MSARGFGSVIWAGAVAGAALGFYLVSLRVASERSALEDVETEIAMAQRDIRLLQTEIGTRGRLAQLERWNVRFIRLSAPTADQFVDGGFQLATLAKPAPKQAIDAPIILASAPVQSAPAQPTLTGDAMEPRQQQVSRPVSEMIHVASYSVPDKSAAKAPPPAKAPVTKALQGSAKPATKPVKTATADPLAPLSSAKPKAKAGAPAKPEGSATKVKSKDSVTD
jgi:hypothetical protein